MPAAHIRVIATPNGGGFGGKSDPFNHEIVVAKAALLLDRPVKICLNREEVFYCHRGRHPVLMRFRTGVTKRRQDHRAGPADAARRRRLRIVRRGEHLLYRRAADRDLPDPALSLPRLPRLHQQAAVRTQARPRHAAEPIRPGSPARQDRRAPGDRSGRSAPRHRGAAGLADGQLPARRHDRPRRVHPNAWSRDPAGARSTASCRSAAASGWPARRICPAPACRSTGTTCRTRACSSSSIAAAASRRSAAPPRSVRDRTMCWWRWSPRCSGIDPFDIRAVTGDTDLTPVDLGSYSSRVTLMMGNAAIQAAERARDLLADGGERASSRCRRTGWCSPSAACSTASIRNAA